MLPLPQGFFTSDKYHRDMKILKILASNSKQFRFYGIFNKWQIDDDSGGREGRTSCLKYSPGFVFLTQETQKGHQNCPKTYWY